MPLVEGSKYRESPVGNRTPYFSLSKDICEYFGVDNDEFDIWYKPDINSKGQKFIGFWLEKKK